MLTVVGLWRTEVVCRGKAEGVGKVREAFSEEVTCEQLESGEASGWGGKEWFLQKEQHVQRLRSKTLWAHNKPLIEYEFKKKQVTRLTFEVLLSPANFSSHFISCFYS